MFRLSSLEPRKNFSKNPSRWASRQGSQKTRHKNWAPPDITQNPTPYSTLSRYSASDYVLGNSSPAELGRFARLFKFGSKPAKMPQHLAGSRWKLFANEVVRDDLLSPIIQPDIAELSTATELRVESPAELSSSPIYELDGTAVERPRPVLGDEDITLFDPSCG